MQSKQIVIIGGGLGGLITAIQLAYGGIESTLIEKNHYPFHRVCGEYVSNEALPFLKSMNLLPSGDLPTIKRFQLSSVHGKSVFMNLDLGGFGVSRHHFDHFLYQRAKSLGVKFLLDTAVENLSFSHDKFSITLNKGQLEADLVIGAYGKRSKLDVKLNRSFIKKKSPYLAVKHHLRADFPEDLIALHNFDGGYCGISKVENGVTNLCYLADRKYFRIEGNIQEFERNVLWNNPLLKYIFNNSEPIFSKPLTINEVSFATKTPVENHVLMTGDAAGMIAPLCGNGMAMAIHGGKLLGEAIIKHYHDGSFSRENLESYYQKEWSRRFNGRIMLGRQMQRLFGNHVMSHLAVNLALYCKPVAKMLIKNSHGQPF